MVETHIRLEPGRGAETVPDQTEQLRLLEETLRPFIDLTQPLADSVIDAMERAAKSLSVLV